jgi:hypothetical protein
MRTLADRSITEDQRTARGALEHAERLWNRYRFDELDDLNARRYLDHGIEKLTQGAMACESKDVLFRWRNRIEPGTADHIA